MKRVIRSNVFETNSSSSHSICVTKRDQHVGVEEFIDCNNPEYLWLREDGTLRIWNSDYGFGRSPFKVLRTFQDKFVYALCEYLAWEDPISDRFMDEYDLLCQIARDICPDIKKIDCSDSFVCIFKTEDGKLFSDRYRYVEEEEINEEEAKYYYDDEEVEFIERKRVPDIGEIDHQSAGLLKNFLVYKGITLKEFLWNKKYAIIIDGDEVMEWDNLYQSGLINRDFIEEIYDKSGEDVIWEMWKKDHANEESDTE